MSTVQLRRVLVSGFVFSSFAPFKKLGFYTLNIENLAWALAHRFFLVGQAPPYNLFFWWGKAHPAIYIMIFQTDFSAPLDASRPRYSSPVAAAAVIGTGFSILYPALTPGPSAIIHT